MRPARISEKNTVKKYCNFGVQLYPMYLCVLKLSLYRESQKTHFQRKIEVVVDNNYWKLWLSLIPTKLIDCCSRCVSLQDSNDDSEIAFFLGHPVVGQLQQSATHQRHSCAATASSHRSHLVNQTSGWALDCSWATIMNLGYIFFTGSRLSLRAWANVEEYLHWSQA